MKYIKYILFFIPHLLVTWVCWLTNPIACLFPVRQPNGRDKLWGIFELWSTFDNPVDEGYYGNYFGPATPMGHYAYDHSAWTRYVYRLKWLSRNTGYGWAYLLFATPRGTGFQWKGTAEFSSPSLAVSSTLIIFIILICLGVNVYITAICTASIVIYLVLKGYHNDFNIGWRDHAGMDKLDYAGRIIGLRRS